MTENYSRENHPIDQSLNQRTTGVVSGLAVVIPDGHIAFPERNRFVWAQLKNTLKSNFGKSHFLPYQAKIMTHIYNGENGLYTLATGAGKTLAFAAPALTKFKQDGGLSIISSPLRALIRNQAQNFNARGISTAYITGDMSAAEKSQQLEILKTGKTAFLIVTPERLFMPSFHAVLDSLACQGKKQLVSRVLIDEAHCIYEWGQSFRGALSHALLDKLLFSGTRPQIVACTATATPQAVEVICDVLGFETGNYFRVSGPIDRTNLTYRVQSILDTQDGIDYIVRACQSGSISTPCIIYCRTRAMTESVSAQLIQYGISARPYHAGMADNERQENEAEFLADRLPIIVATCAYGMGIDKPNVRHIVHFGMPGSLSTYSQETGRAGRDGNRASCELLYSEQDAYLQERLLRTSQPSLIQIQAHYQNLWNSLQDKLRKLPADKRLNAEWKI